MTTPTLSGEDRVSVAEHALAAHGLTGPTWDVPKVARTPEQEHALAAVTAYVNTIVSAHAPGANTISVYAEHWDLRGTTALAHTDGLNWIGLNSTSASTLTLLHECAHIIVRHTHGPHHGHGPAFAHTAATLYRQHLGDTAADLFTRLTHT